MIQPPYLQKNDTVAIVATARKITLQEIEPAIKLLTNWNLKVVVGKTIGLAENQFAGNDTERASDFQELLDNPTIKAIWCARGGYGTVRVIDALDFTKFKQYPKWIIGYSDITVLHSDLHHLGFETIHGIMPLKIDENTEFAKHSLKKSLFGKKITYSIPSSKKNKVGLASGELVGGNLSVLYSLLGSKSSIITEGKILFLEDLDEYLYHMDRMMMNLKRNGYFENLRGLIVGGMTNMHDNEIPFGKSAKEIILDIVSKYDFPVVFNFPAGHITDNRTLIFGRKISLEVDKKEVRLSF